MHLSWRTVSEEKRFPFCPFTREKELEKEEYLEIFNF
jgi:hypothetical protein